MMICENGFFLTNLEKLDKPTMQKGVFITNLEKSQPASSKSS